MKLDDLWLPVQKSWHGVGVCVSEVMHIYLDLQYPRYVQWLFCRGDDDNDFKGSMEGGERMSDT